MANVHTGSESPCESPKSANFDQQECETMVSMPDDKCGLLKLNHDKLAIFTNAHPETGEKLKSVMPSELISHLEKIPFLKGLPSPKLVSCELPVIPLTPYATVCRRTRATSTCTPSLPFCVSLLACE
jgi:hypothetical protein